MPTSLIFLEKERLQAPEGRCLIGVPIVEYVMCALKCPPTLLSCCMPTAGIGLQRCNLGSSGVLIDITVVVCGSRGQFFLLLEVALT